MTQQQMQSLSAAIKALQAIMEQSSPEIDFNQKDDAYADLKRKHRTTRSMALALFNKYGKNPIEWNTREMKRLAFETGCKMDAFLRMLEQLGAVVVHRQKGPKISRIKSFQFVKSIR